MVVFVRRENCSQSVITSSGIVTLGLAQRRHMGRERHSSEKKDRIGTYARSPVACSCSFVAAIKRASVRSVRGLSSRSNSHLLQHAQQLGLQLQRKFCCCVPEK